MGYLAQSLLAGKGLSSPFGVPTGPTAIICPGYPVIVAVVFRAFGSYSLASATALIGINIALNTLCTWAILDLGCSLAAPRGAKWAAAIWALSPPLVWMPTIFWDTSLSVAGALGAVVFSVRWSPLKKLSHWFYFGAASGLLGLVNPALVPCLIISAGLKAVQESRWWRKLLLMLCGSVLLFAPWSIRNARVFHAWIPTRTTMGLELWMGNREGADGFLDSSAFPTYNSYELMKYKQSGEVVFMQKKGSMAFAAIQAKPATFILLTLKRIMRFWMGSGSRPGVRAYVIHASITTVFGLCGLIQLLRQRSHSAVFFCIVLLLFPLPYYITHAELRYRLVIDPLLLALTAVSVEAILSQPQRRARMFSRSSLYL